MGLYLAHPVVSRSASAYTYRPFDSLNPYGTNIFIYSNAHEPTFCGPELVPPPFAVYFTLFYHVLHAEVMDTFMHYHAAIVMHNTQPQICRNTYIHCHCLRGVISDKHEVIITSGHIFRL